MGREREQRSWRHPSITSHHRKRKALRDTEDRERKSRKDVFHHHLVLQAEEACRSQKGESLRSSKQEAHHHVEGESCHQWIRTYRKKLLEMLGRKGSDRLGGRCRQR